jgi:hypothetical protein
VILSGSSVRTDNVELLAGMLDGDQLALKLERAVANKNPIVALSLDDRRRIVAVLAADAPWGLTELRGVLVKQLAQHKEHATRTRRALDQEHFRRRREGLG